MDLGDVRSWPWEVTQHHLNYCGVVNRDSKKTAVFPDLYPTFSVEPIAYTTQDVFK